MEARISYFVCGMENESFRDIDLFYLNLIIKPATSEMRVNQREFLLPIDKFISQP